MIYILNIKHVHFNMHRCLIIQMTMLFLWGLETATMSYPKDIASSLGNYSRGICREDLKAKHMDSKIRLHPVREEEG